MAVGQSSAVDTATAGPNSSSVFSGASGVDVVDDGGGDEGTVALAAGEQRGPAVDGRAERPLDAAGLGLADQGAQAGCPRSDGSPYGIASTLRDERVEEVARAPSGG